MTFLQQDRVHVRGAFPGTPGWNFGKVTVFSTCRPTQRTQRFIDIHLPYSTASASQKEQTLDLGCHLPTREQNGCYSHCHDSRWFSDRTGRPLVESESVTDTSAHIELLVRAPDGKWHRDTQRCHRRCRRGHLHVLRGFAFTRPFACSHPFVSTARSRLRSIYQRHIRVFMRCSLTSS